MNNINLYINNGLVLVPLIIAVVSGIKLILPSRYTSWSFLISMVVGIIFAYLFADDNTVRSALSQGIVSGLMASGLYSGTKSLLSQNNNDEVDPV